MAGLGLLSATQSSSMPHIKVWQRAHQPCCTLLTLPPTGLVNETQAPCSSQPLAETVRLPPVRFPDADLDLILVMTVNPGFGGQSYIESMADKIAVLRRMIDATGRDIDLEVDGGIDMETAPKVIEAGADVLVAGTATFKGGPTQYAANIARMRAGT